MYMPALTAIRNNGRFKVLFTRLVSRHGIKMKAAVAVQRKLLEMIYTMYKSNTAFDKDYLRGSYGSFTSSGINKPNVNY